MGKDTERIEVLFNIEADSRWMGGVNYYRNLFMALAKTGSPRINPLLLCFGDRNGMLKDFASEGSVCSDRRGLRYLMTAAKLRMTKDFALSSHCRKYRGRPNIKWLPDFQHVHLPEMFSKREILIRDLKFRAMARDADLVVLSSGDALRDFKAFCPDHAHKGRVLHFVSYMPPSIYSETDSMIGTVREKYGLPERYFFLPNQFWKHKNHMVVLRALSLLRDDGVDDIHVICTGKLADYRDPGYTEQLEEFIKEKSLSDSFSILGLVGYKEMLCMMRHSLALLQPSLFEGWSSSVEEAKSLGKNCILSDLAVHREQAPAQSVYFNPLDAEGLARILCAANKELVPGPNFGLEETARRSMDARMAEFGNTYKKYVLDLVRHP